MILQLHFAEDFVVAFTRYNWEIPYAYEWLLLDAIEGECWVFIWSDELDAAWALFAHL